MSRPRLPVIYTYATDREAKAARRFARFVRALIVLSILAIVGSVALLAAGCDGSGLALPAECAASCGESAVLQPGETLQQEACPGFPLCGTCHVDRRYAGQYTATVPIYFAGCHAADGFGCVAACSLCDPDAKGDAGEPSAEVQP